MGPGDLAEDALAGEIALVTGGASGIGREVALALARLGAAVAICDISEEGSRAAGLLFVKGDICQESDVAEMARQIRDRLGPVSVLVNAAAACPVEAFLDTSVELWDRVISVNLRGTFLTCKTFLPDMLAGGRGTIVNMVSADAMPYMSAYIASKLGIVGLTRSLAAELEDEGANVQVVAFAPGFVDTPGLRIALEQLSSRSVIDAGKVIAGVLSPELAGAATAYLVAALAKEYHGKVVDGYTVLERAGLAKKQKTLSPFFVVELVPEAAIERAMSLSKRFEEIVAQTDADFNRLPIFLRPMARSQLKAKTGKSIGEWARVAAGLTAELQKIEARDAAALDQFRMEYPALKETLGRLVEYCKAVPREVSRFTRDPDVLREVTRVAAEREEVLKSLIEALGEIHSTGR